jgi:hypothetical protein
LIEINNSSLYACISSTYKIVRSYGALLPVFTTRRENIDPNCEMLFVIALIPNGKSDMVLPNSAAAAPAIPAELAPFLLLCQSPETAYQSCHIDTKTLELGLNLVKIAYDSFGVKL